MLKLVWKLCFFSAKPEDMPYSIPLLLGVMAVSFVAIFYLITQVSGSLTEGLWRAVLLLTIIAIYTAAVLHLRDFKERFVQALSCLFSTQTIVLVLILGPYIALMSSLSEISSNIYYVIGLLSTASLLIIASIWLFLVFASIYESALEISINSSLLVTIVLVALTTGLFTLLR